MKNKNNLEYMLKYIKINRKRTLESELKRHKANKTNETKVTLEND